MLVPCKVHIQVADLPSADGHSQLIPVGSIISNMFELADYSTDHSNGLLEIALWVCGL